MARYLLEVSYDGTCFHGSQLQHNATTVQGVLNTALATLFRQPVDTFGASRTDEGVHALSNFYHFDAPAALPDSFQYQLNAILPEALALRGLWAPPDDGFNARFEAVARRYRYRLYHRRDPFLQGRAYYFPYRFAEAQLHGMADLFLQYTDFTSFAKRNAQTKTNVCTIAAARWERVGEETHFVVEANRFLRGMVRGLVGTQLTLARRGQGREELERILDARDCTLARFDVPGHGLYLEEVRYPEGALTQVQDRKRRG